MLELALFAAVLAQVADVVSTNRAISRGAVEANPVIAAIMGHFGKAWWVVKLAFSGGVIFWAYRIDSAIALVGMSAAIGFVAWRNSTLHR